MDLRGSGSRIGVPRYRMELIINEIAENWNSAPVAGEEETEFYNVLHDPNTDARFLLDGLVEQDPGLTDEQWNEVLLRLREMFPTPEKDCDYCDNRVAVEKRCIGGYVDDRGVSHNSYDYLCEVCRARDGDDD